MAVLKKKQRNSSKTFDEKLLSVLLVARL